MSWTLAAVPIAMVLTALVCHLLVKRGTQVRANEDPLHGQTRIGTIFCVIAVLLAGILALMAVGLQIIVTTISNIAF